VILLDVVMESNHAGFDLARQIRLDANLGDMRIILLTGQPGVAPVDKVMTELDLTDYCLKSDLVKRGLKNVLLGPLRSYRDITKLSRTTRSLTSILETSNQVVHEQSEAEIIQFLITKLLATIQCDRCTFLKYQQSAHTPALECINTILAERQAHQTVISRPSDLPVAEHLQNIRHLLAGGIMAESCADALYMTFSVPLSGEGYYFHASQLHEFDHSQFIAFQLFADLVKRIMLTSHLITKLNYEAYYDAMLDIANRNGLIREIDQRLISCDAPQALLLINFENFNEMGAFFGSHHVRDVMLEICKRLKHQFGDTHLIARVNFDSFYVLGPQQTVTFQAVRQALQQNISVNNVEYGLNTFAVLCQLQQMQKPAENILRSMSTSMRYAKEHGIGTELMYDVMHEHEAQKNFSLSSSFKNALDKGEFIPWIQPKIDMSTGRVIGGEVLIRWLKDRCFIPPAEFIPIAERSTFIVEIGQLVIRKSLEMIKRLDHLGLRDIRLSLNVSPKEFRNPNYTNNLIHACHAQQISSARITLEVVESTVIDDYQNTIQQLHQFRAAGGKVSIDDFGTGMSSLSYLNTIPHDNIKIDRSFIKKLMEQPEDQHNVLELIINIAHKLGKTVVAEGVEHAQQAEWLMSHGCVIAQGWLFAPAMCLNDFIEYALKHTQAPAKNVA
ncbi:MAG TPA: bifunctional diguanylate cyclase/phosphodiesterase, partial [Methylophilus sp.]